MNQTLLLLLGLGLAILAIVLLWPPPRPDLPDIRDWDASSLIKLEPVRIPTPVKPLSAVFTTHTEAKIDLRLTSVEIDTPANPLPRVFFGHVDSVLAGSLSSPGVPPLPPRRLTQVFFSHIDSSSVIKLSPCILETLAKPLDLVFVSHYDAILRTDLVAPGQ